MKKSRNCCKCCTQPRSKYGFMKTEDWYREQISRALKIKPSGKTYHGEPWWRTWGKDWLADVLVRVEKLAKAKTPPASGKEIE